MRVSVLIVFVVEADLSTNYKFSIPDLKVGTLDSLMSLSDEVRGLVGVMLSSVYILHLGRNLTVFGYLCSLLLCMRVLTWSCSL